MTPATFRARACAYFLAALAIATLLLGAAPRAFAQTPPVWIDLQVHGDVAYLLRKSPSEIMRYDMAQQAWLAPIALAEIPSAFLIDGGEILVARGNGQIDRVPLAGGAAVPLASLAESATQLMVDGNLLVAWRAGRAWTLNRTTGGVLGEFEPWFSGATAWMDTGRKRIYYRGDTISSPRDIYFVTYTAQGSIDLLPTDSPYHGEYPEADYVFPLSSGNRVADDSGTVYAAEDLGFVGSLGVEVDDLASTAAGEPIAVHQAQLRSYTTQLVQNGRFELSQPARNIRVRGGKVFAFQEDLSLPAKVAVEVVDISDIVPLQAGPPVSPAGLPYRVDGSVMGADGLLYLLSGEHKSVFRWDPQAQAYLSTIALPEAAGRMAYAPRTNRIYLSAAGRNIYRIDLNEPNPVAQPHLQTALWTDALIPMDQDLLVALNGGWGESWVYLADGTPALSGVECCFRHFRHFDEVNRRLFYNDGHQIYLGNGEFGERIYDFDFRYRIPIDFAPDGQRLITHDGMILETETLAPIDSISNFIYFGQWTNSGSLHTVRAPEGWDAGTPLPDETLVQRWDRDNNLVREVSLAGQPTGLHRAGSNLLVITQRGGIPYITVMNEQLEIVPPQVLDAPVALASQYSSVAVQISWNHVQGGAYYRIERQVGAAGTWKTVGQVDGNQTEFLDPDFWPNVEMRYRVLAGNGTLVSPYSNEIIIELLLPPVVPVDPEAVEFLPDLAAVGPRERVYVLSNEYNSVFGWDSVNQHWRESIPLRSDAASLVYSEAHGALYVGYQDGGVGQISLALDEPQAWDLLPPGTVMQPEAIAAVGAYLLIVTSDGPTIAARVDALGRRTRAHYLTYPLLGAAAYDSLRNRLYVADLYDTTRYEWSEVGELMFEHVEFHGGVIQPPIQVSPDGLWLSDMSGTLIDTRWLNVSGTLPGSPEEIRWLGNALVSRSGSEVFAHDPNTLAATPLVSLPHDGHALLWLGDGRFVAVMQTPDDDTALAVYRLDGTWVEPPILIDGFE